MNELRIQLQSKAQVSKLFRDFHNLIQEILSTEELLQEAVDTGDQELKEMLQEDLVRIRGNDEEYGAVDEMLDEIVEIILPKSESDSCTSCTLEIMQAAGGSESSLFAEDILTMYQNFCRKMGFSMKQETL